MDYTPATFVAADGSNYRTANRKSIDLIVIHITDGRGRARAVAEMWQEPGHKSSAHFVIGQDGEVIQAVRVKDIAWHAHSCNKTSVGIEHCARTPGELGKADAGLPLSSEQYAASAKLVAFLCHKYDLPVDRDHIKGHCEADPDTSHEDCPNSIFDWAQYMSLVATEWAQLGS